MTDVNEMEEQDLPDFTDKVVLVYMRNAPRSLQDGVTLVSAAFELRRGRVFLSGRVPKELGQEWSGDCHVAVSWDDVLVYIEYQSLDEFNTMVKLTKPTLRQKMGL
jgi:hypothetical protein